MTHLKRLVDQRLLEWKSSKNRKPLLLRGARQVGKTWAVRHLAPKFDHYIEVDFLDEENKGIAELFEKPISVAELCEKISAIKEAPIEAGKTLLFLDEIQACPSAISRLRYFYEQLPELHVIAAGSLLEFALEELPSFGVGRIRSLFMYPLNFFEFLNAVGQKKLASLMRSASPQKPLDQVFHEKLSNYLRTFLIIGGLPEVVATWRDTGSFLECRKILDDLLLGYRDDFEKYKKRVPAARIQEVFRSVAEQSQGKFVYSHVNPNLKARQISAALDTLLLAGLVYPVTHSDSNGIPLGAQVREDYRRMIYFDTGLLQRQLNLSAEDIIISNDLDVINKGAIAETFVGTELMKAGSCLERNELYCWHREEPGSNAEVDYVVQCGSDIIPIEVKASKKGSMQSLRQFLALKKRAWGVRSSLENFCAYDDIHVYPLYAISNLLERTE